MKRAVPVGWGTVPGHAVKRQGSPSGKAGRGARRGDWGPHAECDPGFSWCPILTRFGGTRRELPTLPRLLQETRGRQSKEEEQSCGSPPAFRQEGVEGFTSGLMQTELRGLAVPVSTRGHCFSVLGHLAARAGSQQEHASLSSLPLTTRTTVTLIPRRCCSGDRLPPDPASSRTVPGEAGLQRLAPRLRAASSTRRPVTAAVTHRGSSDPLRSAR